MQALLSLLLAVQIGPGAQPQLAANQRTVAVAFGAHSTVYFSASTDQGRTFSAPVKVADAPMLALGRHRGPRVAITPSAIVVSALVGTKMPKGSDGDLKTWRSTDGGKTWSEGGRINDVTASAREGLHTMIARPDGLLFAAWLDLRKKGTQLYSAVSKDSGATWSKNTLVYEPPSGNICECCHPTSIVDAKGTIHVMWRNALGGARDMYVARSNDGGATFGPAEKQGSGSWALEACPMDGGGLAFDSAGALVSIWRRENDVYLAEKSGAEKKLETGKDPAIAAGKDGVYAIWTADGAVRLRTPGATQPSTLAPQGAFPQLIGIPNGPMLAAWEDRGQIFVEPINAARR